MGQGLSREQALATLALPRRAQPEDIKRAYRRLAREHHPDLGGDPDTFRRLADAYVALVDEQPEPEDVAQGRPSRAARSAARVDVESFEWEGPTPQPGDQLDRDRLARTIVGWTVPICAASRSPGSRLNRLASHLAGDATARITIRSSYDDRKQRIVAVEIRATSRKARSALEASTPTAPGWLRRRGSASTTLSLTVPVVDSAAATAANVANAVDMLLDELGWDLTQWTLTDGQP